MRRLNIPVYGYNFRMWPFGLVAMIPALGAGGPGFKSRNGPTFLQKNYYEVYLIFDLFNFLNILI